MKKGRLLALGLLCGMVLPLSTQAYEDGIYTGVDENGNEVKTVIFGGNDTFSGVQLSIKMEDQTGTGGGYYYYRGFNTPTTNSKRSGYNNPGEGIITTETGYQYGNTNGEIRNNLWGGSGDTYENGFNPAPTNFLERQGPCDSGYHVPSRGERNALVIAWCNIDTGCNARYGISGGVEGDFQKAGNWTSGNNLIYTNTSKYGLGAKFKDEFNMSYTYFWSSSPYSGRTNLSWYLLLYQTDISPDSTYNRNIGYHVRCLKNSIVAPAPQTFIIKFFDDGVEVASGSVVSGEVRSGIIPTLDEKEGYEFDYRYVDGEPGAEFDFTSPITGDVKLHAHWTFTADIPNGIYTGVDENGNQVKTLIFGGNDAFSGVHLTVKMENQSGNYYRGFNKNTDNSYSFPWNATGCTGTYFSGDGKLGGCTNGVDNARGGSGDTVENGFNPNPINFDERQGPCEEGYHVPSRGERNALAIARCNDISNDICNPNTDFQPAGDGTDFIYISNSWAGSIFQTEFNVGTSDYYGFWSSSPGPDRSYTAYRLVVDGYAVNPNYSNGRYGNLSVRCFKNYIAVPYIFTVNFLNGDEHVWSGDIVSGDKVPEEVISGYNLTGLTKEGYTFSGWIISGSDEMFDVENDIITTGMTLKAFWNVNQYTITFKDGDGEITSITADYGTGITPPSNPTKNGYKFTGWDPEVPATMPAENMTINAKWERNGSSGGGGGGGGGGGSSSKTDTGSASSQTGNQINSNTGDTASTGTNVKEPETNTGSSIQTGSQVDSNTGSIVSSGTNVNNPDTDTPGDSTAPSQNDKTYSTEFQQAYEFAKGNGITTMPTIQKANMEGKLTRIAMAKMLSQYAINVLGKTPDTTQSNKFNDVTDKLDSDYDDGVTLAYQLGIMGQNMPGNNFRPNDEVTRAEFGTALSRMAYGTSDGEYKATSKYYVHHMEKLVKEGIITNDDPNMKELRGYVMIMLMRSTK